jgi:aquaporin Z
MGTHDEARPVSDRDEGAGAPQSALDRSAHAGAVAATRQARGIAEVLERAPWWGRHFDDLRYEWRRWFGELLGTFLLVLAGAGAPVVDAASGGQIGRVASVAAPALTVLAVILFMGAVSGAHLNPVVTIAFTLRGDFGWRRVPGYLAAQLAGAVAAGWLLRALFAGYAAAGLTLPGHGFTGLQAFVVEAVLTFGLVSTVLGTASAAQNLGPLSAFGVGAYILLAGLWSSPVSGASMNPARSAGPALTTGDVSDLWIYLAAPTVGMLIAVAVAWILRGPGGGPTASRAAQGTLVPPTVKRRPGLDR